jgi:hypothetical protein
MESNTIWTERTAKSQEEMIRELAERKSARLDLADRDITAKGPGAESKGLPGQVYRDDADPLMLRIRQALRRLPPCSLVTVRVVTDRNGFPLVWFVEKTDRGEGPLASTKHALDILSE